MPTRLNVRKVVQAIAVLLRTLGCQRLEYLTLIKMLYIADRESWQETGHPITEDVPVAMEYGPVLSEVYDLVNLNHGDLASWTTFLRREEYDLELLDDPGVDQVAPYELRKLQEVAKRYSGYGWRQMVEVTHTFPEWLENKPDARHGPRMQRIPIKHVLRAVGREGSVDWIEEDLAAVAALERALGR